MKNPSFFIVGEPKSGTTTFHNILRQHPEIFIPEFKEPNFFSTDLHKKSDDFHKKHTYFSIRTQKDYLQLFKPAQDGQLLGEVSPLYLFSGEAAQNIREFNPDSKIIIFLREPVNFLYSFHSELCFNLHEDEADFARALSLENSRKKKMYDIPKTAGFPDYLYYSQWVDYQSHIARFIKNFPLNHILIILFDDILADERHVYREILKFLGVCNLEYEYDPLINRNSSKVLRFKTIKRIQKNPLIWQAARTIIPKKYLGKAHSLFSRLTTKRSERRPLDHELKKKLMQTNKSRVEALETYLKEKKLLNRDIVKLWGYHKIDD